MSAPKRPEQVLMANANRCTVHPQHVMVNQGRSEELCADLFVCACGETAIANTDERRFRYAALDAAFAMAAHRVSRQVDGYVRGLIRRLDHEQHQPRPLCIDGHAYRRRRNARRSRR